MTHDAGVRAFAVGPEEGERRQYIFECEDQTIVAKAGTFVFLPRGLPHRFHVGVAGGRMLILGVPVN